MAGTIGVIRAAGTVRGTVIMAAGTALMVAVMAVTGTAAGVASGTAEAMAAGMPTIVAAGTGSMGAIVADRTVSTVTKLSARRKGGPA